MIQQHARQAAFVGLLVICNAPGSTVRKLPDEGTHPVPASSGRRPPPSATNARRARGGRALYDAQPIFPARPAVCLGAVLLLSMGCADLGLAIQLQVEQRKPRSERPLQRTSPPLLRSNPSPPPPNRGCSPAHAGATPSRPRAADPGDLAQSRRDHIEARRQLPADIPVRSPRRQRAKPPATHALHQRPAGRPPSLSAPRKKSLTPHSLPSRWRVASPRTA